MNSTSVLTNEFAVLNFLNSQINLDVMTFLAKGLSFRQIARKIGKKHSFVQTRSDFLRNHAMMVFGRWNVDVQALGMVKTAEFYEYKEEIKNGLLSNETKNFYLSYLSQAIMGEMKYFAMYTYPEEVNDREGTKITSWYYTFPHFTLPFFKNGQFEEEFKKIFEEEDNENLLPPRGEKLKNPDLIDIYICRYVQLELGDVNLKRYARRMKEEIGDLVDVHYSTVRTRFQRLRKKNIIYPVNPLDLMGMSFVRIFCITTYDQVFRFMKTLNQLNIITAISFMENGNSILYIQCPYDTQNAIANILSTLDRRSKIFSVTKMHVNRGLPYKYYLRKLEK
ncbi:MAG: hypothetical protein AYK18_16315 [Theionarchaea archaeon DG-70]|nr:MAG: hypothetical protein AYK18_16315 [Theionarchaea archaeon DG-70]